MPDPQRRAKRLLKAVAIAIAIAFSASHAAASPERSTHRQQILLGANATNYFYIELVHVYPGTYYNHIEIARLCSRRKADAAFDDSITVSEVRHSIDPRTGVPRPPVVKPLPPFDLAGYLRDHIVHFPWPSTLDSVAIDSIGVYFVAENPRRTYFLRSADLLRQVPDQLTEDAPVVRGAYRVHDTWNRVRTGEPAVQDWYFEVDVGEPDSDSAWERVILYAPRPVAGR